MLRYRSVVGSWDLSLPHLRCPIFAKTWTVNELNILVWDQGVRAVSIIFSLRLVVIVGVLYLVLSGCLVAHEHALWTRHPNHMLAPALLAIRWLLLRLLHSL